jgi:hypothetical protein
VQRISFKIFIFSKKRMFKHITNARATLPNGELVMGPVTTADDETFLFVNRSSSLDFYLEMKKGQSGWHQSGGPEIQYPQNMVDELGTQIDEYLTNP